LDNATLPHCIKIIRVHRQNVVPDGTVPTGTWQQNEADSRSKLSFEPCTGQNYVSPNSMVSDFSKRAITQGASSFAECAAHFLTVPFVSAALEK